MQLGSAEVVIKAKTNEFIKGIDDIQKQVKILADKSAADLNRTGNNFTALYRKMKAGADIERAIKALKIDPTGQSQAALMQQVRAIGLINDKLNVMKGVSTDAGHGFDSMWKKLTGGASALFIFSQLKGYATSAFNAVESVVNSVADLAHTGSRLGVSIEMMSKLQYVAKLSGVDINDLAKSFGIMERNVANTADGTGKTVDVFNKLNINAAKLKELSPEQQFLTIADVISKITNQDEKMQAVMAVFGRGGGVMLQILNEGPGALQRYIKEAEVFAMVTGEQADKLIRAHEELIKFDTQIAKFKREIVIQFDIAGFVQSLNDLLPQLGYWAQMAAAVIKAPFTKGGFQAAAEEVQARLAAQYGLIPKTGEKTPPGVPDIEGLNVKKKESAGGKTYAQMAADLDKMLSALINSSYEQKLEDIRNKYIDLNEEIRKNDSLTGTQSSELWSQLGVWRNMAVEVEKFKEIIAQLNVEFRDLIDTFEMEGQSAATMASDTKAIMADINSRIAAGEKLSGKTWGQVDTILKGGTVTREEYEEGKGEGGFMGFVSKIASSVGINVNVQNWKKNWDEAKKLYGTAGASGIMAGQFGQMMMQSFQVGQQGGGALGALSSGLSMGAAGAGAAQAAGAGTGGVAAGGIAGLVVGTALSLAGTSQEKRAKALAKKRAEFKEASQYADIAGQLGDEGFTMPTGGVAKTWVPWMKKDKKGLEEYLKTMQQLSQQISQILATALAAGFTQPTVAAAREDFIEKMKTGIVSVFSAQVSEMIGKWVKYLTVPLFQWVDQFALYFQTKWRDTTKVARDAFAAMMETIAAPVTKIFDALFEKLKTFTDSFKVLGTLLTTGVSLAAISGLFTVLYLLQDVIALFPMMIDKVFGRLLDKMFVFSLVLQKTMDIEPDWVQESRRAGFGLDDDMGKRVVEQMKSAWDAIKGIISSALSDAFSASTVGSGWETFKRSFTQGIYKWVIEGIAAAFAAGSVIVAAIAPYAKQLMKMFVKMLTGKGVDFGELGNILTGIAAGINQVFAANEQGIKALIGIGQIFRAQMLGLDTPSTSGDINYSGQQAPPERALTFWENMAKGMTDFGNNFKEGFWKAIDAIFGFFKNSYTWPAITAIYNFFTWLCTEYTWPAVTAIYNFFTWLAAEWKWPVITAIYNFFTWLCTEYTWPAITAIYNFFTWLCTEYTWPAITAIYNFFTWLAAEWKWPVITSLYNFITWLDLDWKFPVITSLYNFISWLSGQQPIISTSGGSNNPPATEPPAHVHSYQYAGVSGNSTIWRCSCGAQYLEPIIGTYASGSDWVPRTGIALLHQGEAVIGASENRAGGRGSINITVNAVINSAIDIQSLAQKLGYYMEQQASFV